MDQPVNFAKLADLTGGDAALEAELFTAFFETTASTLTALQAACISEDESAWRKQAHALKGVCFNLGAQYLGDLCGKAQEDCRASIDDKHKMIVAIETELARVRDAITSHQ